MFELHINACISCCLLPACSLPTLCGQTAAAVDIPKTLNPSHWWMRNVIMRLQRCGNRVPRRNREPGARCGKPRFHKLQERYRSCRTRQVSTAAAIQLRGAEPGLWNWSKDARQMTQALVLPMPHKLLLPIHPKSIDN